MMDAFSHMWDCEDQDALIQHFGPNMTTAYEHCTMDQRMVNAARVYFGVSLGYAAFVVVTTVMFVLLAVSNVEKPYYQYAMLSRNKSNRRSRLHRMKLLHRWNRNSLRKRSIFGTTLGAVGNLVFCTSMLISQAFYLDWACELYLWGALIGFYTWFFAFFWRLYRLRFLIRLNELKARYGEVLLREGSGDSNASVDTSCNSVLLQNDNDYRWFMKNKDCHRINTRRPLLLYLILLLMLGGLCVGIEVHGFRSDIMTCEASMGIYLVVGFTAFFLLLVAPITVFLMRNSRDSYGIRNEILVDIAVGIPCFIMTIVWYALFGRPVIRPWGEYFHTYFAPRNWLIFFMVGSHIMTIIVPLVKLCTQWHRLRRAKAAHASMTSSQPPSLAPSAMDDTRRHLRFKHLRQTPETLEYLLESPDTVEELMRIAVQDFDSENVVFYKQYLRLVDRLRIVLCGRSPSPQQQQWEAARLSSNATLIIPPQSTHIQQGIKDMTTGDSSRNPAITIAPPPCIYMPSRPAGDGGGGGGGGSGTSSNARRSRPLSIVADEDDDIYDMPIEQDGFLLQDFIDLYRTYICEGAPLQVNVSHRARKELDSVLQAHIQDTSNPAITAGSGGGGWKTPWSKTQPPQLRRLSTTVDPRTDSQRRRSVASTTSTTSSIISMLQWAWGSQSKFPPGPDATVVDIANELSIPPDEEKLPDLHLTLGMFEPARNEVFWNIFAGVFPKYVNEVNKGNGR